MHKKSVLSRKSKDRLKYRSMLHSSLREIIRTKTRFLSILGIIFLGAAFFVGIGATGPDMIRTADNYYKKLHLADNRITSALGLTDDDLALLNAEKGTKAEGIKLADINLQEQNEIVRFYSYTDQQKISQYSVIKGRLPEKSGEIALDNRMHVFGSKYKIGDTFTVNKSDDAYDSLKVHSYKIVGFVNTPAYVENVSRGNTNVGTGSIDYYGVIPEADFASDFFAQILLTYENLADKEAYSDAYEDRLSENQKKTEALLKDRPKERLAEIKADAQTEIDDGKKKISDGEKALSDAEKTLADSKSALDEGRQKLTEAQNELDSQISSAASEIASQEAQLVSAQNELDAGRQQLTAQKQQLEANAGQIETARQGLATLAGKRNEATTGLQEVQASLSGISAAIASLSPFLNLTEDEFEMQAPALALQAGGIASQLPAELGAGLNAFAGNPTRESLDAGLMPLYGASTQLEAQANEISAGIAEIDSNTSAIQGQIYQYESGAAQISSAEAQLAQSQQQIDSGRGQINDAKAQLAQAESDGQAQISASKEELETGEKAYQEGLAEFEKEKADKLPELEDAKREIADQEAKLADLKAEDYTFETRENNPGYTEYKDNANRISSLATVFPMIFFLIAALVSLTTMTRMVEEKRTEIGTFKALGYSNAAISMKFLLYSAIACSLGVTAGLALGYFLFPTIIFTAYGQLYNIPDFVTPWYWNYSLGALLVSLLCTVGTAVITLRIDLISTPAILMRPKAPKAGQRILLERVKPVWKRISFIQKVTMRNLFRYKQRMLMTILGIAGCMAMIITGFGIRDSISDIVPTQFDKIWHYRAVVTFKEDTAESELKDYFSQLEDVPDYKANMLMESSSLDFQKAGATSQSVTVYAPKNPERMDDFILFNDRASGKKYKLDDNGALINEKLAKLYKLKAGDSFTLKDSGGREFKLKISAVAENYTGHFAFVTPAYYEKIFGRKPEYNANFLLFDKEPSSKNETKTAEDLMENDEVINVSFLSSSRGNLDDTIGILNIVVWVLIISAGLLAFIVLYNLTNINVSERIRELSTIKVLGFYDQEVTMYVYRENILLTMLGILAGCVLGKIMHAYVLQTVEVDLIMFSPDVHLASYGYSALLTLLFTLIVGGIMHLKLRKVDMIEALKSNE